MMLTETEKRLIHEMCRYGVEKGMVVGVLIALTRQEQQEALLEWIDKNTAYLEQLMHESKTATTEQFLEKMLELADPEDDEDFDDEDSDDEGYDIEKLN